MHLSKSFIYFSVMIYSGLLLFFQDWPHMVGTTGQSSALWLAKMVFDIGLVGMGLVRLVGPAFFASDEDDDEVGITEDDLHFSDTSLFGLFLLNLLGNGGWHAYLTINTTGLDSTWYSVWFIGEVLSVFVTTMLWRHAIKAQRRAAKRARDLAAARSGAGPQGVATSGPQRVA